MSRARWAPKAQADLARIDEFNAKHDPEFADRVGRAAIAAGEFLAEFPSAGPLVDGDDRKWTVPHTDYVLIYRIAKHGVDIVRAYHGRENWRPVRP